MQCGISPTAAARDDICITIANCCRSDMGVTARGKPSGPRPKARDRDDGMLRALPRFYTNENIINFTFSQRIVLLIRLSYKRANTIANSYNNDVKLFKTTHLSFSANQSYVFLERNWKTFCSNCKGKLSNVIIKHFRFPSKSSYRSYYSIYSMNRPQSKVLLYTDQ